MKHVALCLTAVALLCVLAPAAHAQGALSYPMGAHVAARYGVHHPGHNTQVIHQVSHRHPGYYRSRYHGYRPRPVVVHPPVYRHPAVVPHCGHPAVLHPPVHRYPSYYHRSPYGFSYSTPRYSIRIGF